MNFGEKLYVVPLSSNFPLLLCSKEPHLVKTVLMNDTDELVRSFFAFNWLSKCSPVKAEWIKRQLHKELTRMSFNVFYKGEFYDSNGLHIFCSCIDCTLAGGHRLRRRFNGYCQTVPVRLSRYRRDLVALRNDIRPAPTALTMISISLNQ